MALRQHNRGLRAGAPTVVLAALAAGTTGALAIVEFGRVWKRGRAPLPTEADEPLKAAAEAAAETAEVAIAGYRAAPTRDSALLNLLASFVISFITVRSVTYLLRERSTVGPFRNLKVGKRHVHHFVPGITLAFVSGSIAIVARNETVERWMALPFGAGMGMTLDESALLLELDDVYWSEEGILSVQITLAVTALLAATGLAARVLLRGEQQVLTGPAPEPEGR